MPKVTTAYELHKERARQIQAAQSESGRDIGAIPAVVNIERKKKAEFDFRFFCEQYFAQTFTLEWSPDHLRVIDKIEQAVLFGGLFALAMPRGSGKSSLCEIACIWAILYGHHNFVILIGSSEEHANEMLASIKTEIESNELLAEDFPEVCYPIERLDGIANRCKGQLQNGESTYIAWTNSEIVLPTVKDSAASGAIIRVAGITGRIRGMKFKRRDGKSVRPSLAILDDPQSDESARSESQCKTRERVLAGAVLGLAGPGRKISGIMPCTVIRAGDMADAILNRDNHPEWNGERTKMIYKFPINEKLWEQYAQIRADSLRAERGIKDATEFYVANRAAMDDGSEVAWKARFNTDEASALQHAMNLKLQDNVAFFSEYQNDPIPEIAEDDGVLTAEQIARKLNGVPRSVVPIGVSRLTMFIDVQGKMLFYTVVGWEENFTGYVVDYGTYPDQKRNRFTLRDSQKTLQLEFPTAGIEAAIYGGLDVLTKYQLKREWKRDDGAIMKIERCLIDANWGDSTDVIYQFCRQSEHSTVLLPSHGKFVGAASTPFAEYKRKPGERVGHNWRIPTVHGKRAIRHVLFDTNYWKTFIHARLSVKMGDPGCLSFWGKEPHAHELVSEHLVSEHRIKTEGRGRVVYEWKLRPNAVDNHWFDCLVGSAVAAAMQGSALNESSTNAPKRVVSALSKKQLREKREKDLSDRQKAILSLPHRNFE